MNVKRYYEIVREITRDSDSLARKSVWSEGDFIQAQVLVQRGKEYAVNYAVYRRLELRLSFQLPAGTIITKRY